MDALQGEASVARVAHDHEAAGSISAPAINRYSEELADRICEALLDADESGRPMSLSAVCKRPGMPPSSTVYLWMSKHPEFMDKYTRACEARSHLLAEAVIDLAHATGDPNDKRVKIDAHKWYAGKLNGKYSDKQVHEHTGKDGAAIEVTDPKADARRVALLLQRAARAKEQGSAGA